jgi:hypothetical protein
MRQPSLGLRIGWIKRFPLTPSHGSLGMPKHGPPLLNPSFVTNGYDKCNVIQIFLKYIYIYINK